MIKVYYIAASNAYDGFDLPEDYGYLTEAEAQAECDEINKRNHYKKDEVFNVYELKIKETS